MQYKIIDFHTHPYDIEKRNLCHFKEEVKESKEDVKNNLLKLGVEKICGSVIELPEGTSIKTFDDIKVLNDTALHLAEEYDGFYVPGFHVHPHFVKESIAEIERMDKLGVKLIGELVPYIHFWDSYYDKNIKQILEAAAHYKMIVSLHGHAGEEEQKQTDEMIKNHKDVIFVAAHPGEKPAFLRHLRRMEMNENYYLDLAGTGIYRHGILRYGIDCCGAGRFLFGSDYPICNLGAFIGGVASDYLLTEDEKEQILYKNARRLLQLD